jgi:DNA-binding response OmpR family regulator
MIRFKPIMSEVILIVDDEIDLAVGCERVLKKAGFRCLIAHDGPTALSLFDSYLPALVLSDVNLGNGDGFEIAQHVSNKSPATPVILMTALSAVRAPTEGNNVGALLYLQKPFSNADLISAITSLLGTDRGTHSG